jgi:hypothetical protein
MLLTIMLVNVTYKMLVDVKIFDLNDPTQIMFTILLPILSGMKHILLLHKQIFKLSLLDWEAQLFGPSTIKRSIIIIGVKKICE